MIEHYHICPACDEMWDDCKEEDCIDVEKYCDGCYAITMEANER